MRKLMLFLCTGNYYRSRFAELLFNHLATELSLDWSASSRGLALELGVNNEGPISQDVLDALDARGIALQAELRNPLALINNDLEKAHHIVAVNSAEHRPLLEGKFPNCRKQIEFWHVCDRESTNPEEALALIELNVFRLISRLYTLEQPFGADS
jgi:protein-tyrosine phosphatase